MSTNVDYTVKAMVLGEMAMTPGIHFSDVDLAHRPTLRSTSMIEIRHACEELVASGKVKVAGVGYGGCLTYCFAGSFDN